ncbi:hypothetical protein V6N13_122436 [Hibiscus sabdariffa]
MSAEKVFDEMLLRDEEVKVVKHMCVSLTEDYKPMEATHGLNGIDDSVQELTMSYVVETLLANGLDNKPPKVIVLSPIIALAIKGNSAYLNFPEIAHELPRPTSASPKDIPALSYTKRREVKAPTVPSHDTEDSSLINNDEAFIDLPDLLLDMNLQIDELWGSESWKLAASDYAAENGLEYEEPRLMEYF